MSRAVCVAGVGMIEEPVQPRQRNIAMDRFEHIEKSADGLVVRGVQAEGPATGSQMGHHGMEFLFERGRELGPRLEKVLKIGRGEREHLARAVHPVEMVAVSRLRHPRPAAKIVEFLLGPLRE